MLEQWSAIFSTQGHLRDMDPIVTDLELSRGRKNPFFISFLIRKWEEFSTLNKNGVVHLLTKTPSPLPEDGK